MTPTSFREPAAGGMLPLSCCSARVLPNLPRDLILRKADRDEPRNTVGAPQAIFDNRWQVSPKERLL